MARLPIVPENWLNDDQPGGGSSVPAGGEVKAAGPKDPIGPVEGYPETGKNACARPTTTSSLRRRRSITPNEIFFPVTWSI